jgi:hypothetical protein
MKRGERREWIETNHVTTRITFNNLYNGSHISRGDEEAGSSCA